MSYSPKIEARNISIAEAFRDFYVVPMFQREYVWEPNHVHQLLDDIFGELYDGEEVVEDSEYFIGSIVAYEDENKVYQLIDGQQRLTTIYLIFCTLRNQISDLGSSSASLNNLIFGITQDLNTGEDLHKSRLSLHYNNESEKFLKELAKQKETNYTKNKIKSKSVENLHKAQKEITSFFKYNLPQTVQSLKRFSTVLSNRVKLIRIETSGLSNALKVFETINDRGVGLNPVDLLKNYLFVHTQGESSDKKTWNKLKIQWDELLKSLYQVKEQPISFLRYYLLSDYEVDLQNNLPEENVYEWLQENPNKHNIEKSPLIFVENLVDASSLYANFLQCKNADGSDNIYLKNIKKMQGRYRQHYILLIAGRHLPNHLFSQLTFHIENLLFVNNITRSTRRKDVNLVREFSQWSNKLRKIQTDLEFHDFIRNDLQPQYRSFTSEFEAVFVGLKEKDIAQYRIRYILAKIAQYIESVTYSNFKPIEFYLNKAIHVEHILSQNPDPSLRQNFDRPSEYDDYVRKLGNLTLLEQSINSSIGNKPFNEKIVFYKESQLLISRVIFELPQISGDTQIDRAIDRLKLKNFESWTSYEIEERQNLLMQIAKKVWGLVDVTI
ncbi:hypothetical protein CKA32_005012 [Geitlerinema sp. FC II]|nr:hypothetical protein CKA32_005012 [Geitlerinema sp. FC II]